MARHLQSRRWHGRGACHSAAAQRAGHRPHGRSSPAATTTAALAAGEEEFRLPTRGSAGGSGDGCRGMLTYPCRSPLSGAVAGAGAPSNLRVRLHAPGAQSRVSLRATRPMRALRTFAETAAAAVAARWRAAKYGADEWEGKGGWETMPCRVLSSLGMKRILDPVDAHIQCASSYWKTPLGRINCLRSRASFAVVAPAMYSAPPVL
eukprot:329963-Chlamydomonas_euryale.AAC.5